MEKIKFFGLNRLYQQHKDELLDAAHNVCSTGQVLGGDYTRRFEKAIAKRTKRKHAIAVNSCTQALEFSLLFASKGETVAIPSLSFVATYNSIKTSRKHARFIDTDVNGLLDINKLNTKENKIDSIVYVNLYGNVLDYNKLKFATEFFDKEMPIIEDAAQSFGASYHGIPSGKLGDVSCLSFDPTKNLPNFGSGGMVLTDDDEFARKVIDYRCNGKEFYHVYAGTNSQMSEVDCAQMLVKLRYFNDWQKRRTEIANYYSEQLKDLVTIPTVNPNVVHSWHKYVIHTPSRANLQAYLTQQGIETKIHYTAALPKNDCVVEYVEPHQYQTADLLTRTCLSLPIYPELTDSEVEVVVDKLKEAHFKFCD